jgi:hypothetical protein
VRHEVGVGDGPALVAAVGKVFLDEPLLGLAEKDVRVMREPPPRPTATTAPMPLNDQRLNSPYSPSLGSQKAVAS